jgi:hypothetical protein
MNAAISKLVTMPYPVRTQPLRGSPEANWPLSGDKILARGHATLPPFSIVAIVFALSRHILGSQCRTTKCCNQPIREALWGDFIWKERGSCIAG